MGRSDGVRETVGSRVGCGKRVEVLRRAVHADQAHRPLPAHVDLVEIALEQAGLLEAQLEEDRKERLAQLAQESPLVSQIKVLDQLLGQGAAALDHFTATQVDPSGAQNAAGREAGVLEEGGVLCGENREDELACQIAEKAVMELMYCRNHTQYLANISPKNERSKKFFEKMGFVKCQETYIMRVK